VGCEGFALGKKMASGEEGSDPQQTTETVAADQSATAGQAVPAVQTAAARVSNYMVDRSKHYHEVNAGANRRQATRLRAPALTWHRAFWLQPEYGGIEIQDEKLLKKDRDHKKEIIDRIIMAVWSFIYKNSRDPNSGFSEIECYPKVGRPDGTQVYLLFGRAVIPQISEKNLDFPSAKKLLRRENEIFTSDNRVVGLKFCLHGMGITLRVELHSEYFTLTLYAEFPGAENPDRIKELPQKLKDMQGELGGFFKNPTASGGESLNELFFHTFWRRNFLEEFLADDALAEEIKNEIFQEVFADFRGLIVCEENYLVKFNTLNKDTELDWGHQIKKSCMNLFSHHERYECTASYMLDGRAAYSRL
jgi:hypothetical protein